MTSGEHESYDVGGVQMPRPFRVRRLGHFALTAAEPEPCAAFYRRLLGFACSEVVDYGARPGSAAAVSGVANATAHFLRHAGDHHSLVIFGDEAARRRLEAQGHTLRDRGVTVHHLPFECGSLREVADSRAYFERRGVRVLRAGRYMPGSNWFVYLVDPDGTLVEVYHGLEQIGWTGRTKPEQMHGARAASIPELPVPTEAEEVDEAIARGVDLEAGRRSRDAGAEHHDVDGIRRPRPFLVTGVGPVKAFVTDVDESATFYTEVLGLTPIEESIVGGHRCVFLRSGTDHHELALVPRALAAPLALPPSSSLCALGIRVASSAQLRAAARFLQAHGIRRVELPPALSPGIEQSAFFVDPEGHVLQLYCDIEQIGWDGRPRPASARRHRPIE